MPPYNAGRPSCFVDSSGGTRGATTPDRGRWTTVFAEIRRLAFALEGRRLRDGGSRRAGGTRSLRRRRRRSMCAADVVFNNLFSGFLLLTAFRSAVLEPDLRQRI